jgi:hypothetical protein
MRSNLSNFKFPFFAFLYKGRHHHFHQQKQQYSSFTFSKLFSVQPTRSPHLQMSQNQMNGTLPADLSPLLQQHLGQLLDRQNDESQLIPIPVNAAKMNIIKSPVDFYESLMVLVNYIA